MNTFTLSPLNVVQLLRQYGLRPDARLGQNFLIDETALQRVVQAAEIQPDETVLEIGPGLGSLTRHLALASRGVVAVELDQRLLPVLSQVLQEFPNTMIVAGDILGLNPAELINAPDYLVVANIPYNITSALIRHLLEAGHRPTRMVLTVQREVAERICATPGAMSLLALSVQLYGEPKIFAHIPAGAFYPAPKVDSSIVRVDLHPSSLLPPPSVEIFFRLAKAGFSQKRKMLRNALAAGLHWQTDQSDELLHSAGIIPQRRAETLSLHEWFALGEAFSAMQPRFSQPSSGEEQEDNRSQET
jgi:16S rRNA (adenine1518-N6/adenine1519-N6)-dimethyltransferase